ncbi:Pentafunctional AROM polypeptide [Neonectria ditissima]|uniref:Pentafunctional AROM polypeptide n=1 Tax=Neonectria ditissima TaxID=78410 RepID=A0A0P7BF92_9HYPO|nr:Pentafunctional AROM polypeptide [Neonectria ditissima]
MVNPVRVSVLGVDSVVLEEGLWPEFVVQDLIEHLESSTYVLITDTNLVRNYVPAFESAFLAATLSRAPDAPKLLTYSIHPGEGSKVRNVKAELEDWLLSRGCTRDTAIIALGGGVVGDLAGYLAATYMRGIKVVQVPTTLLAMVDSSIGGKTAVNTPAGKNLIGSFWQPERIYVDLAFLNTLPAREFANGMAEAIKVAAISDEAAFVNIENSIASIGAAVLSRDASLSRITSQLSFTSIYPALKDIILHSIRTKAHFISLDEREHGPRSLLNFGHSVGHAIESVLAPAVLHGEAVSVGMIKEAEISRHLGVLSPAAVSRLTRCIAGYGLPTSLEDETLRRRIGGKECPPALLLEKMAVDKKNYGTKKKVVLLSAIGETSENQASVVDDRVIRLVLSRSVRIGSNPSHLGGQTVTITPPGSKSICNRALVLATLAGGTCRLRNFLHSDDTTYMLSALKLLSDAGYSWEDGGDTLLVNGSGGNLHASKTPLYLGNAGTATRFLASVVAICSPTTEVSTTVLTGNKRMTQRPIGDLVDALRSAGVNIDYLQDQHSLPVEVHAGGGLSGGIIELAATVSSQFVSSLLLVAPYAREPTILKLVGGMPVSQPYIDMTISMMASFGINVKRATGEAGTYFIPCGTYRNPTEYTIESDASSATYPLAIAAVTGSTCVIPGIGSGSIQGDAKFATGVLAAMGCEVRQTEHTTMVRGPPTGNLRAISDINMSEMTDAFLTASVVAAVASGTTRITGIANQRVKECNRIKAMKDQLAKYGVTCMEHQDGIEIIGRCGHIPKPSNSIFCYDDHRVAMSFSVLSTICPDDTVILDRNCVGKTWPGWWDVLSLSFGIRLEGIDQPIELAGCDGQLDNEASKGRTIFIIGMRGAGKTTVGRWAADILDRRFVDLDTELEERLGQSIPTLVRDLGWNGFRRAELDLLKTVKQKHSNGYVFACGGGIVETPEARELLIQYHQRGGYVIWVHRDTERMVEYLMRDRTRPAFSDKILDVYNYRRQWFEECSNFYYCSRHREDLAATGLGQCAPELSRLLRRVTSRASDLQKFLSKEDSFFVSLTFSDLRDSVEQLDDITVGADAVEVRVDLLKSFDSDFIRDQVSLLRSYTDLPLIYTVRTQSQGGNFPDHDHGGALRLYRVGLQLGVEFLDLEVTAPDKTIRQVVNVAAQHGITTVIASHHDPKGVLSWQDGSWMPYLERAVEYGSIVKLVGIAQDEQANIDLARFKSRVLQACPVPTIALNMGHKGRLSRIMNHFLTPASHPKLPSKAAPGQLSIVEILQARGLSGMTDSQKFFLLGKPIQQSLSPTLHNTLFRKYNLPHRYNLFETDQVQDLLEVIRSSDFGGASVTIPLKVDALPLLDEVSQSARTIGAINTIIPIPSIGTQKRRLFGENTDWAGIVFSLRGAGLDRLAGRSRGAALVIGAGGTSRAAIYALHSLQFSPILICARNSASVSALIQGFPSTYDIQSLESLIGDVQLRVVISTIPASKLIDGTMWATTQRILRSPPEEDKKACIFLDMAYGSHATPFIQLAQDSGWRTVSGIDVLAAQGWYQFQHWTGIKPMYSDARAAIAGDLPEDQ